MSIRWSDLLEEPPSVFSTSEKNTPAPTRREKAKTLASESLTYTADEGLGTQGGMPGTNEFHWKDFCKEVDFEMAKNSVMDTALERWKVAEEISQQ